jgi:hypothetical protein
MTGPTALLAALLFLQAPANSPPEIEDETAACARPGSRPRICARVFDDKGVAKVRALFRASGNKSYFATEMMFDGARYCVTLPVPLKGTKGIEYYLEAVDTDFEPTRMAAKALALNKGCSAPSGPAGQAEPTTVSPVQPGERLRGFEPATFKLSAPPRPAKDH